MSKRTGGDERDIVARLRGRKVDTEAHEAADEIERLRGGFTREDVEAIRDACGSLPISHGPNEHEADLLDLADRIEALLPPEEG